MKEILIYSSLYGFITEFVINQLNEIPDGEDFVVRLNTPGGDVLATWGLLAKIQEKRKKGAKATLKIDGMSMSMGIMFMLFFDEVEALNTSKFMIHKAAMYGELTDEQKIFLDGVNSDLYKLLNAKINNEELKKLKGVDLKTIFSQKVRNDYFFSASEMKQLGLVDKIVKLESTKIAASAESNHVLIFDSMISENTTEIKNKNIQKMTREELLAQDSALLNSLIEEGRTNEQTRVNAWIAWSEIDNKAVLEGIKSGKVLDAATISELSVKAATNARAESHKRDNTGKVETAETKTEEQLKAEAEESFWKKVNGK